MSITVEQINQWLLADKEDEHLEFKEAKNQYDSRKLVKYCTALANEGGGHLIFGVTDKLPRQVVGSQACLDVGAIKGKLLEKLQMRIDIQEVQHSDGRVVVFMIPSRPQGVPMQIDGAYWMRSGENLVTMTADQLKRIFAEGQVEFEIRPVRTGLDGSDVVRMLDIQHYFDLIELPYPQNQDGVIQRFCQEKLVTPDSNGYTITNMGALLFAKNLNDFPEVRRKAVRITTYDRKSKLTTLKDHFDLHGYASGFENLIQYIDGQIPDNQAIGQALRETVPMYPNIAIRELVANAIIHQDLEEFGNPVTIDIYTDRIEISNPGAPPIAIDRFIDTYQIRNHILADLMRRLRICEEKGSGIDKVITHVEISQLPPPDFRASENRTIAILFAQKELKDMNRPEKTRACYQHCCLKYVMNDNMTNTSLRERFGLGSRSRNTEVTSRIIAATIEDDLIKLEDPSSTSKRYAKYVPYWA